MMQLTLLAVVLAAAPVAHKSGPIAPQAFEDRVVRVTDEMGPVEVHLAAPPLTTTLTFSVDIAQEKVLLVDPAQRVHPPIAQGNSLVIAAKERLPKGTSIPLTVTLADGTQLNFALLTAERYDRSLKIELALTTRAGVDNAQRLKTQLQEAQSRLDECVQSGADEGARKIAALILRQDLSKPDVFTVERHSNRSGIDKQNQLLVETQYVFRLFDLTYLAFSVENRSPTQGWVLERAELAVTGGGSSSDVRVLEVSQELTVIPAGEVSKMVIAFKMPAQESAQQFTLRLFEKNGARHVELTGLKL